MSENENPLCPHCGERTKKWATPRFNVGEGLGWHSPYLYVCFNDACPLYVRGWQTMMQYYGRVCSCRYMFDPESGNSGTIPVGTPYALRGDILD